MMFSIVLVVGDFNDTYSLPHALPRSIAAVDKLQGQFELVLVNNQAPLLSPKTTAYLRDVANRRPNTKLVETEANLGCAGGFNRGAQCSDPRCDILVYMSCDAMVVDPRTLERIEAVLERYPAIGLAHPLSIYEDVSDFNYSKAYSAKIFLNRLKAIQDQEETCSGDGSPAEIDRIIASVSKKRRRPVYPTMSVPLTFLAIRRSVFHLLGGFDEAFLNGGENDDFTLRALQKGYSAAVVRTSFVFHRRLLFRCLAEGRITNEMYQRAGSMTVGRWKEKWGRMPIDVYRELRYGPTLYRRFVMPIVQVRRWVRQLGGTRL